MNLAGQRQPMFCYNAHMVCCKSFKYHAWCKNEDTVAFMDDDNNKYCIFHAPAKEKNISNKDFNKRIFKKIEEAKEENSECNLGGTIFPGDIIFGTNPLPPIYLNGAHFNGRVWFDSVTTLGDAIFINTNFSRKAEFHNVTFSGKTSFVGATFNGEVLFANTSFRGEVDFVKTSFIGDTWFSGHTFYNKNTWMLAQITNRITFENVDLSGSLFEFVDNIEKTNFINCTWAKRSSLRFFFWFNKHWRNVLYDEVNIFTFKSTAESTRSGVIAFLSHELNGFICDIFCRSNKLKLVEDLYRKLKHKYKEEHNDPEVSNWHYGEKEMYRKSSLWRRFNPISFSNLYWLFSGYGERPVRAGMMLVFLVVVLALLLGHAGLKPSAFGQQFTGAVDLPSAALSVLQYATFQKDPLYTPTTNWGHWLRMLCQLLLPLQTAMFAFALRNKFRR